MSNQRILAVGLVLSVSVMCESALLNNCTRQNEIAQCDKETTKTAHSGCRDISFLVQLIGAIAPERFDEIRGLVEPMINRCAAHLPECAGTDNKRTLCRMTSGEVRGLPLPPEPGPLLTPQIIPIPPLTPVQKEPTIPNRRYSPSGELRPVDPNPLG